MLFENIFINPIETFAYLERYVNDGSPSGFSFLQGVSEPYHPLSGKQIYNLPLYAIPWQQAVVVGRLDSIGWASPFIASGMIPIPIHPDLLERFRSVEVFKKSPKHFVPVRPTASERTVMTAFEPGISPMFIKLHYPKIIGRFNRAIPLFKWLAAIENARLMREYVKKNSGFSNLFKVFDEFAAVFFESGSEGNGFGTIYRSFPEVLNSKDNEVLIPAFSMFSQDYNQAADAPLMAQIISEYRLTVDGFLETFISPLINSFVHIATTEGLIPECNAQNIIFHIDNRGRLINLYIRDMEDLWKDLSLRQLLGLESSFVEYHTIRIEKNADYYQRRSFMYDFKLGNYILAPLARVAACALKISEDELVCRIKDVGRIAWSRFPNYFQPEDSWFCYSNVDSVSREKYEERARPHFR